jgi:hypothetical protein
MYLAMPSSVPRPYARDDSISRATRGRPEFVTIFLCNSTPMAHLMIKDCVLRQQKKPDTQALISNSQGFQVIFTTYEAGDGKTQYFSAKFQ